MVRDQGWKGQGRVGTGQQRNPVGFEEVLEMVVKREAAQVGLGGGCGDAVGSFLIPQLGRWHLHQGAALVPATPREG